MSGQWKTQSYGLAAAARRIGVRLSAAVFFIALILSAGPAQACPPGMNAETSVAVVHAAKGVVLFASAVQPIQINSHGGSVSPGDHCSGASHSSAHGCQIGCWFACSAVMDTSTSILQCLNMSTDYSLAAQRGILSKEISSLFRPPKSLA
jgi:hypothetical protein